MKEKTLKYLNSLKSPHSKVKHIKFEQLNPQEHFFHKDFTFNYIQILFMMRTRIINVKKNFSSTVLSWITRHPNKAAQKGSLVLFLLFFFYLLYNIIPLSQYSA